MEAGSARLRCQQGWFLLQPFLGLQTATFLLGPHTIFPLCLHIPGLSVCPNFLFL